MSRRGSQWATTTWKRAFEGALIAPTFDKHGEMLIGTPKSDNEVTLKVETLEDSDTADGQGLKFPPRQYVYVKIASLMSQMQWGEKKLRTTMQTSATVCDSANTIQCTSKLECHKYGVPDAFTAAALIEWLMTNLNIQTNREASHLATLLCRIGYIYPCKFGWELSTITLPDQEDTFYRFQSPFYWPTATLAASETDHACYLLSREHHSSDIPLDEFESKYLSKVEKNMNLRWNFVEVSTATKENLLSQCCAVDQTIKRWQEFAYWRVNRPQMYQKFVGSTKVNTWSNAIRGMNRKFNSYSKTNVKGKKEKKKTHAKSPTKVLATSCTRIMTVCTEWMAIDPFFQDATTYYNPWRADTLRDSWPQPESGPSKLEAKSWGLSFEMLIQSEIGQQYFEEHLKKEFSDENLYFYCEVVNLKCAKEKEVEQLIKSIFTDYISPNGSTPVNIDTTIVKHVKQELKANKSRHIFDTALDHIYTLMRKDSYKRFLTSPIYKEALNNAKHPCKPRKEKGGLPKIWRLSQFLPKKKPEDSGDPEKGNC